MAAPPASTKTSLQQRLSARARERWPQLSGVDVRFRGAFAYVTGELPDGEPMPLMRLRYLPRKQGRLRGLRPTDRIHSRRARRRPRHRLWPLPGRPNRLDLTPDELTVETTKPESTDGLTSGWLG